MKIFVLILSLTTIHVVTFAQARCTFAAKNEIVRFINWKISSDNAAKRYYEIKQVDIKVIAWDSSDYEVVNSIDTLLAEKERLYMKKQLDCYLDKKERWRQEDFSIVRIMKPKPVNKIKKRKDHYWAYSVPIFSENHSYCVLKYQFECGGGLCASYMTTLFKKTDKGWVEIKELMHVEA
jgi:hypothetical protein